MKKLIIKIIYILAIFAISLLVISGLSNKENMDMTAQMPAATYPVVSMIENGTTVNVLHGYAKEMQINYMHGTILPINKNRQIKMQMELYDTSFENLSFEVRTLDGSSLVENTPIKDYTKDGDKVRASFQLKDLIDKNTEYMLVVLADVNGKTIRYYTRIVWTQDDSKDYIDQKLAFVSTFHAKTFDKEKAKELATYLESNSEGDNSSFSKVTINSSLNQVSWGKLNITAHSDPEIYITDLHQQTGSFRLDYTVTVTDDQKIVRNYDVQENFRVRYTSDRIYLLDYSRTMNYVFDGAATDYNGNVLSLSISDPDLQMVESDGGGAFAFVSEDRLYVYNVTDKKIALLFGFYNKNQDDIRTRWKNNKIQILSVDEAGNVEFLVAGYMDRGHHEGDVGTAVYDYNSTVNTIEEKVFIPSTQSEEIVMAYAQKLAYSNHIDQFYMMQGDSVYGISLSDRSWKTVIEDIVGCNYRISESGGMIAWQNGTDLSSMSSIHLMDMNTQSVSEIDADNGEYIRPLGFMGEDLVYGKLYAKDIHNDQMGNPVYAMYSIIIRDKEGNVLKNYKADGIYVTDAEISENQITLTRVKWDEQSQKYVQSADDQIMSTLEAEEGSNIITTTSSDVFENTIGISMKDSVNGAALKMLTPSEILFEGNRDVTVSDPGSNKVPLLYYTYGQRSVEGIYTDPADAIKLADQISGVVVDNTNRYIWVKGNLQLKNQIMSITNKVSGKNLVGQSSTAVCLDLLLQNEGINQKVEEMLQKGNAVDEILSTSLPSAQVLDLGGCSLSTVLYYVNQDIPVMAMMNDGSSVLIIGFNDLNTVILDPAKGSGAVYKYGMQDSEKLFDKNGNHFVTFLMPQTDSNG